MQKIHIVGYKPNCFTRHLFPVLSNRKALLEEGLDTRFFSSPTKKGIEECDVLIFMADGHRNILPKTQNNPGEVFKSMSDYFKQFNRVIWFDDNDSSGMLNAEVFPIVDIYLKSQIMRDLTYYQQQHLTGAVHRDYVNETYNIIDRNLFSGPITERDIKKLKLGWNLSLINWNYYNSKNRIQKLRYYLMPSLSKIDYTKPHLEQREKKVFFRGRMWEKDPTIGWWRQNTVERINSVNLKLSGFQQNPFPINRKQYQDELQTMVVTPSPFGKGEICYRDFECFMNGSLLFKPNMDHMVTWPNLYLDGTTFISHRWDFSDYEEKLSAILEKPAYYEEIAREGQLRFQAALNDVIGFTKRFFEIIS